MTENELFEADRLSRYLVGSPCPETARTQYSHAIQRLDATLDEQQMLIWKRMLHSTFVMRSLDGGLALLHPTSALRKRIFIMVSLLETEPALAHHFLPQNRGIGYLLWLMVKMAWAILTAIVGVVLVKLWCVK